MISGSYIHAFNYIIIRVAKRYSAAEYFDSFNRTATKLSHQFCTNPMIVPSMNRGLGPMPTWGYTNGGLITQTLYPNLHVNCILHIHCMNHECRIITYFAVNILATTRFCVAIARLQYSDPIFAK